MKCKPIDPSAPGETLLRRLRKDHRRVEASGRDGITSPVISIVAFTNGNKSAALRVSTMGGYLHIVDGSEEQLATVPKALAWYRQQIASNWFKSRVDNDDGWILLLGMAEGLAARQMGRERRGGR